MIIEIKQVTGSDDKSPNKEALLTRRNIETALNNLYPDEEFSVTILEDYNWREIRHKSTQSEKE